MPRGQAYWAGAATLQGTHIRKEELEKLHMKTNWWEEWLPKGLGKRLAALWILWTLIGVAFGMANQGWDFTTSVYFSVTAMSTGGLQGLKIIGFSLAFVPQAGP